MREILFRARKSDGKWVEGYYVKIGDSKHFMFTGDMMRGLCPVEDRYGVEPETLCQYTGLVDENGGKIFEGDIVRAIYNDYVGVVKFGKYDNNYGYYIEWISVRAQYCRQDLLYWVNNEANFEVVGNIFDNPEILEDGRVTYEL